MKKLLKKIREKIVKSLRSFLNIPPNYVGDNGCIRAAATFIAANQIEGDYLEFGVWKGYSFVPAFNAIVGTRLNHFQQGFSTNEYNSWKNSEPRFFAFDSFEGLPEGGKEATMVDYEEGSYACSEKDFLKNLTDRGVDLARVTTVKGFYNDTCIAETKTGNELSKAAMVMIDCDLYSSTVPVLNFITDIIGQGTIIIFDDWFRFKANPNAGEQLACREWLERNPHIELIEFWRQGPQAVSFVVNIKVD
jgi:O-methyltransferase